MSALSCSRRLSNSGPKDGKKPRFALVLGSPVSHIQWTTSDSEHDAMCSSLHPPSDNAATGTHHQHGSPAVTVTTSHGRVVARRVIIAVPPNLVPSILFQPPLPHWRSSLHAALTQGHVIKDLAVYPTPLWRSMGLSGEGFAPHSCSTIKEIYDNTPPSGSPGVICSFLVGDAAARAAAMPGGVRGNGFRNLVVEGLALFLGSAALAPDSVVACDWCAEKWTAGGYCGTFGLGGVVEHFINRDRNVGPIFFAATELAGAGHMHMEGALRSGAAAAAAVRAEFRLSSKL
jgi:putrescine oxidase